jgi:esterase/lipase
MDRVEDRLGHVQTPVLVIQAAGDPVVDPKSSRIVFKRLGTKDKTYTLFNFDRHGILLGDGAERVYRAIGNFLTHLSEN